MLNNNQWIFIFFIQTSFSIKNIFLQKHVTRLRELGSMLFYVIGAYRRCCCAFGFCHFQGVLIVIKFVSDLMHIGDFLCILRIPSVLPTMKLKQC